MKNNQQQHNARQSRRETLSDLNEQVQVVQPQASPSSKQQQQSLSVHSNHKISPSLKSIRQHKRRSASQDGFGNYPIIQSSNKNYPERLVYPGKGVYEGTLLIIEKESLRHGHGRFISTDGRSVLYEGEWLHDKYHGYGMRQMSDGSIYHGNFKEGKFHGFGIYSFYNGDKYIGHFHHQTMHGQGKMIWSSSSSGSGNEYYEGDFCYGEITGVGIKHQIDGSIITGSFDNNRAHGYCIKSYLQGDIYSGHHYYDKKEGYGKYKWADGCIYIGDWTNDCMSGLGQKSIRFSKTAAEKSAAKLFAIRSSNNYYNSSNNNNNNISPSVSLSFPSSTSSSSSSSSSSYHRFSLVPLVPLIASQFGDLNLNSNICNTSSAAINDNVTLFSPSSSSSSSSSRNTSSTPQMSSRSDTKVNNSNKYNTNNTNNALTDDPVSSYKGDYLRNQRNGYGVALFWDGRIYAGEWKHDKPHGYGRCLYTSSPTTCTTATAALYYEGDFCRGQRQGIGQMTVHSIPIELARVLAAVSTTLDNGIGSGDIINTSTSSSNGVLSLSSSSSSSISTYSNSSNVDRSNSNIYCNITKRNITDNDDDVLMSELFKLMKIAAKSSKYDSAVENYIDGDDSDNDNNEDEDEENNANNNNNNNNNNNVNDDFFDDVPELFSIIEDDAATAAAAAQAMLPKEMEVLMEEWGHGIKYQGEFTSDKVHGEGIFIFKGVAVLPKGRFEHGWYIPIATENSDSDNNNS